MFFPKIDSLPAVAGLRDNGHIRLAFNQRDQAFAHDTMVVSDQNTDTFLLLPFHCPFLPIFFLCWSFHLAKRLGMGTQLLFLCPSLVHLLVKVWRRFDRRAPSCLLTRCLRR